mmetsp:Transcript_6619/g.5944  ORF Transcript_6619/g.5944 Transcript_6619/m.5944 type:complete len:100 (+) Transcript_6619:513-812(+)
MDKNKNNYVSENEFKIFFESDEEQFKARIENVSLTKEMMDEIDDLFRKIDTNNDGSLTQDEVKNFLGKMGVQVDPAEQQKMFNMMDKDGNRQISRSEFF